MTENNKVVQGHKIYRELKNQCEEYLGYIRHYSSQCDEKDKDLRFLYDFLRYKGISDEFDYFRKNAHEVNAPDILPYYTL